MLILSPMQSVHVTEDASDRVRWRQLVRCGDQKGVDERSRILLGKLAIGFTVQNNPPLSHTGPHHVPETSFI